MRVRWVVAGLVALAGFALSVTPGTYSAPTRSVDLDGNRLSAGVLRLDLGSGSAAADLSFPGLMPGGQVDQRVWLANDVASPVAATLALTLDRLRDQPAGGLLSRLLELRLGVAGTGSAAGHCAGSPITPTPLPSAGAGNLRALAGGNGTRIPVDAADGSPLVLGPGHGVCLAVSAFWPPSAEDDAAEGDALALRVVFELSQVPR